MFRKFLQSAPSRFHVLCAGIIIGVCCGMIFAWALLVCAGCAATPVQGRHSFWTETQAVEDVSPRRTMQP